MSPGQADVPVVVELAAAAELDLGVLGGKAASLARLAAAGFPVPPGFVVTTRGAARPELLDDQLGGAVAKLGGGRMAVRSSAVAEDLADASFAGQYETVLDVPSTALAGAVRQVLDSAAAARVATYTRARAQPPDPAGPAGMAVLVQVMVDAKAAGVAFTADPVTGERDRVLVTAVGGLGERLVAGSAVGDQWTVSGSEATCHRRTEGAIGATEAVEVAELARKVHAHMGTPQDIEWAIAGGRLWLLQARPMTALPDPVAWTPPGGGLWMRNFRLGEWLPEPMTPLFAGWLLELLDAGLREGMRATAGAVVAFPHAAVNGWYYTALSLRVPLQLPGALLRSRGRILRVLGIGLVLVGRDPELADRLLLGGLARTWQHDCLPRYEHLVQQTEARMDAADRAELISLVETVGRMAGEALWWLEIVGGSAWKMEGCLARFHRQHLAEQLPGGVQSLLGGLPGAQPDLPAHAVHSLDWYHPTAGELGWGQHHAGGPDRHRQVADQRAHAEAACRAALVDQLLARFESILTVTQRYAVLREQQARALTRGWPVLRRCVLRLGAALVDDGVIDQPEDVFFLTRAELTGAGADHRLQAQVTDRRARWERQRRLTPPLALGRAPRLLGDPIARSVDAIRTPGASTEGAIVGHPASPGRATGPVRIVRGLDDFGRLQPGEVLVAPATTPAWTPLFERAAAVVTDGGSLAAHASLVAREYGIPAVVGTGQATTLLVDGQPVTVDGGQGTVTPHP